MPKKPRGPINAQQEAFINAYIEHGKLTVAAEKAGVSRTTIYNWKKKDQKFAVKLAELEFCWESEESDTVHLIGIGKVEAKMPQLVALMFMLKARNPKKYREMALRQDGSKFQITTIVNREATKEIQHIKVDELPEGTVDAEYQTV